MDSNIDITSAQTSNILSPVQNDTSLQTNKENEDSIEKSICETLKPDQINLVNEENVSENIQSDKIICDKDIIVDTTKSNVKNTDTRETANDSNVCTDEISKECNIKTQESTSQITDKHTDQSLINKENNSIATPDVNILNEISNEQLETVNLINEHNVNDPKETILQNTNPKNIEDCSPQEESVNNADVTDTIKQESIINMNNTQSFTNDTDTKSKNSDVHEDIDISNIDQGTSDKNASVPENTEFVQFSQDKHGDSQIENQSIDAEDPFAGDNLTSENVEQMETDSPTETSIDFSKLCEQGDILQNIVHTRDIDFNTKLNNNEKVNSLQEDERDKISLDNEHHSTASKECAESIPNKSHSSVTIKAENKNTLSEEDILITNTTESINRCNKHVKKDAGGVTPMETEEEQSDILPGQDDELCIIPDSMKMIIPEKVMEKKNNDKSKSTLDEVVIQEEGQKSIAESVESITVNHQERTIADNNTNKEQVQSTQEQHTNVEKDVLITTDVINLDDESKNSEIEEISSKEMCKQCNEERSCKIKVKIGVDSFNVCSKTCKTLFKAANNRATDIPSDTVNSKRDKRCANCLLIIESNDEKNLSWETMEFCNEECLGKFQNKYGSYCRNCNGSVQAVSLGKYCVRFGYDVRQFCCSTCLEEFKKGLKVCSYCQKDISSGTEGFLAPVGDKGQFKDFCTQNCMEKYSKMSSTDLPNIEKKSCSVCQEEKLVHCEVQLDRANPVVICSEPCFAAFKFVNKVDPDQCSTCKQFFELQNKKSFVIFYENEAHTFCTKTCLNIFIITNRKIVPCNWCKVKKYNFDMIKKELKNGQIMMMCSLNCLTLYQVSINAVSAKRINCDFCKEFSQAQYHLTMSDATIRNFCSYNCVMNFQSQYTKSPITIPSSDDPVPTGMPKRTMPQRTTNQNTSKVNEIQNKKNMPVISSVTSLATIGNGQASPSATQNNVNTTVQNQVPQIIYKQQIITRPPSPTNIHNKITQCKPLMHTKGVSVRPHPCTKSTQTEETQQMVIPIPVPIYVPYPVHMFSMPFPIPLPFPLPIPVPVFIPTTRNSTKGIFKDIKRIQEKIPADPFEAELLMMAEMVATEKKTNETDSDSAEDRDDDGGDHDNAHSDNFSPDGVDSNNTFGDMLQMALKMATGELDEPAVDLEAALTSNTITATQTPAQSEAPIDNDVQIERSITARGRKRVVPYKSRSTPNKKSRRVSATNDMPLMPPPEPQPPPQPRILEPIEKPDANMALKYTFGVNAWRQWVVAKNAELEKQSTPLRKMKLFKTDLLQLTADELNYSLCLFVKEVRKPNGAEYAPDTIYYLCLGIQQYLFENNRIDNIFTDSYYEKFTDCLNEVAKKFSVLYNDTQYIVTRVEEEHLWECKQLGAHSPHVLLSTLMFFNTKHFNLVTVEEHMQLSFSHIMKHWKRNPAAQPATVAGKVPGSRNVLLRFYPPQSALEANSRKKKVYEQQENEENPLRCPVKLYEFYLSKCPESVKTRNDVFYLLPERSCVPDSPVWYSTSPLAKEHLVKMLYRVKMVKEINVALLTS
ncbi:zinc finger MYM-type protein 3 isoform X1 [Vespa velutina]|uniref:zinc finger MYM-type protein 3 isoform X1 n=1 Tax=Vespa velutina TaxID=202808 RepID=UPI001FB2A6F3|nr:zinc finger MYM-type protein 3 isoform X1 [Vespa velutina]XP_047357985.1 zinc finger MYM-type protein 3 isoform X1 [Vespa velutina]XP_047357986.1 zinc finger MYM-type protein 3 isoform X1 [Vespa velutina]